MEGHHALIYTVYFNIHVITVIINWSMVTQQYSWAPNNNPQPVILYKIDFALTLNTAAKELHYIVKCIMMLAFTRT